MIKEIKKLKIGEVYENVSYKELCTYRLQGYARCVCDVLNEEALIKLLTYLKEHKIPYKILGSGSNIIFKEDVYEGVIIHLKHFDKLQIDDNQIKVGGGYPLMKVALKACKLGFTGLEFATGIPGTVGGAIYNNAGAYASDMGYVILEAKVLTPSLEVKTLKNREMQFHYRDSFFKHEKDYVILEAKMLLKRGKKEDILSLVEDRKQRRIASQPLDYPSAGSVFRNPESEPAGKIIEELGFKGKNIGGAEVSEKHANFIINKGNAKGKDVCALIDEIKKRAKEEKNIDFLLEQEII